ncbi:tetratricopeptide repeat protein [Clostridium sp. Cult1]|uniref:tetratricopeptide repeat protein n=1 Tax=Clostridium sp. Cult1 TaxID=2079002 RepID=UPI001F19CEB9|nr:tetratricopeptide repeat protein [Clostridium sp. Cult1]MCF6463834.1 hypothetical protein [Clostridium sp. Cult1]
MSKTKKFQKMNFLDAVNKLIKYYNEREFSKVIGLYENIFKKLGIDEDKLMTRDVLPEVYTYVANSYVELGYYNRALQILNSLNLKYMEEEYEDLFYIIVACFHQIYMYKNNFEKELEYAEKLIELNPKSSDNYFCRGFAYLNLKKYEAAEKDLLYALKRKDSLEVYLNLIDLYMTTHRFKEALKYINKGYRKYKRRPGEFLLLYVKIAVLIKLKDYTNLSKTLEDIYSVVPDNKPEYKIALLRIEGKDYSEVYDIVYNQFLKLIEDPRKESS